MSTKLSPCTWPISRLPKQYSVPPKQCGWDVIPDQPCRASSILSFAPETAIQYSRVIFTWMGTARCHLHMLGARIDAAWVVLSRASSIERVRYSFHRAL